MNLLKETLEDIGESGYTPGDIIFIGSVGGKLRCTWEQFAALADREYDDGYRCQEVASDLIIVFSDKSKLYRAEYDGSEWWVYDRVFEMPEHVKPVTNLFTGFDLLK